MSFHSPCDARRSLLYRPGLRFLLSGPEGPEPALGFFEKKTRIVPLWSRSKQQNNNKSFRPTSPGVAGTFFFFRFRFRFRYRLRFVNVADVTFSFTLRSHSGREARVRRIAARV